MAVGTVARNIAIIKLPSLRLSLFFFDDPYIYS